MSEKLNFSIEAEEEIGLIVCETNDQFIFSQLFLTVSIYIYFCAVIT